MNRPRVALETQFSVSTPTGLGVYSYQLAQALRRNGAAEIVEIRLPGFDLWRFDRRVYWDQFVAPALVRKAGADIAHFTGGTLPLRMPHPVVLTLHDLSWRFARSRARTYARWYFGSFQPRLAQRADLIVTDTQTARMDIMQALKLDASRVAVCGAGIDERFFGLERRPQEPAFALSVGTLEARKDLVTAVHALASLDQIRLVSVGPHTPYVAEVRQAVRDAGSGERVELRGWVADDDVLDLYAAASLLVFPSRYEGFGLPPLQALAAGLPVVAADIPVLRETLAECAWYAPAGDRAAFAAAIAVVLSGGEAVKRKVEQGRHRARMFAWPAVAARLIDLYKGLS